MGNHFNPYSLLARLPLFQGMSLSEFDNVIAHVKLGFSKVERGGTVVAEGEVCNGLSFVLQGELDVETVDGQERLALTSDYSNVNTLPTDNNKTVYEYYVGD